MRLKKILSGLIVLLLASYCINTISSDIDPEISPALESNSFFVSPAGSNSNPGTLAKPWKTFGYAAQHAKSGSTVYLRKGMYREKVQILVEGNAKDGFITFTNYPDEKVVISGEGVKPPSKTIGDCIIYIEDKSYIRITGLEITSAKVTEGSGIRIYGSGSYIELRNNSIHDIRGENAMGITVYGTDGASINNLIIDNNEIYDCDPARSEALTLNGNVEKFEITNNIVRDVNNIGIDMIGGETWLAKSFVRNGICRGNIVLRARSAYEDGYAAGIYVDGANDIIIEKNIVSECDLGIEVGAENPGVVVKNIIVRNNIIFYNDKAGLVFGGYESDRGIVTDSSFLNNTIYANNVKNTDGEVWVQYSKDNRIQNNIIIGKNYNNGIGLLVNCAPGQDISLNTIDNNIYYVVGEQGNDYMYIFNDQGYQDFNSYQTVSGQDKNSVYAFPFVSGRQIPMLSRFTPAEIAVLFQLPEKSSAIDRGRQSPELGSTDFSGNNRVSGTAPDCGALEYIRK